ncbi:MAG: hypothetical protein VX642_02790 [Bdellovibrionota bacterium]|nr:hypothetical protein [Bdellovibrionota bacterium]
MKALMLIAALGLMAPNSFAGKADDIVEACGGKISKKEASRKIKDVYMRCNKGTKVKIKSCEIDCKNETEGAKIGG